MDHREELALLPITDPEIASLLASVSEEKRCETWWFVQRDGALVPGHPGGGVALVGQMRLTRPISRLLTALHLSPLIDELDRRFAIWRSWMSDYVPNGPAPRRYP